MSASLLIDAANSMRASADEMRAPMTPRDAEFLESVADWLDRVAAEYQIAQFGYWSQCAVNVARVYLGQKEEA